MGHLQRVHDCGCRCCGCWSSSCEGEFIDVGDKLLGKLLGDQTSTSLGFSSTPYPAFKLWRPR